MTAFSWFRTEDHVLGFKLGFPPFVGDGEPVAKNLNKTASPLKPPHGDPPVGVRAPRRGFRGGDRTACVPYF